MSQASTRPVPMSGQAAAASSAAAPAGAAVPEPLHNKQKGSADKQTPFTSVAAKKTVWILQKVGAAHKKLEFEQEQCSGVKGDVGDDVGVGSIQEDETTLASRVAATAHDVGLQEDLLFLSDVVKSKLQAAKDVFDAQTVQFLDGHPFWKEEAEDDADDADAPLRALADLATEMKDDKQQEQRQRVQEQQQQQLLRSLQGFARADEAGDGGGTSVSTTHTTAQLPTFGLIFPSDEAADAFVRSKHGPVRRVPGSNTAPVYLCSSNDSAMPARKLAEERKRRSDDPDPAKDAKDPRGARAKQFFQASGCHGCVQVCSLHEPEPRPDVSSCWVCIDICA